MLRVTPSLFVSSVTFYFPCEKKLAQLFHALLSLSAVFLFIWYMKRNFLVQNNFFLQNHWLNVVENVFQNTTKRFFSPNYLSSMNLCCLQVGANKNTVKNVAKQNYFAIEPLGGSKVDSAFHPSEVGKMSTRNFWELSGKK